MGSKSITEWLAITSQEGKTGWTRFYKELLGHPVSKPAKFFEAVDNFGQRIMFESILSASTRTLEGDPLSYVLAIAISKVNEEIEQISNTERYRVNLEKSKQRTEQQNEQLESKLLKALGE